MTNNQNTNNNQYFVSQIIEHNLSKDYFETLTDWLHFQQDKIEKQILIGNQTQNELQANIKSSTIALTKEKLLNNPSFIFLNPEGESIKIADIRDFNQKLSFANYNEQKRYFIFFNSDLTTLQAQNAALKSIEEPPANTQILLLTSTISQLLPTIISRCEVISLDSLKKGLNNKNDQKNQNLKSKNKIKANNKEIAEIYNSIINAQQYQLMTISDKYKDRPSAALFLNKLLNYLNTELHKNDSIHKKKELTKHLKIILKTMKLLRQNINVKLAIDNCLFEFI